MRLRIQYNAPVVLTFALLSLGALGLDYLTGGWTTLHLFCVYRAPLTDPLTYVRLFGHVLGHAGYAHYMGNMMLLLVVGPPPMMKFTGLELMKHGVDPEKVWMSFERKMSCAVGKCGHCRIDEVYVCLDGPVFPYTVARDLVD